MGDFADGLKEFFSRGAKEEPVRLNKRMKEILLILITDTLESTYDMCEEEHDRIMEALTWVKGLVKESDLSIKLSSRIGWTLCCWMHDNRYHPLSAEKDFDKALTWISNKLHKKYSHAEMVQSGL